MRLIKAFILRQRTRPNEQEALSMVMECQIADRELGMSSLLDGVGQTPFVASSLTRPGDVQEMMPTLMRSTGDERFLSAAGPYMIKSFQALTGADKEATSIALVYERDSSTEVMQSVREIVDRSREWEAAGRIGDALLSCHVGLDAHPNDIDLLFMQGRLQTKIYPLVPRAVATLQRCREARPDRADYAAALADAYEAVLSNNIPIKGATREQFTERVIDLLTIANRLSPGDASIVARLAVLRGGEASDDGFFG